MGLRLQLLVLVDSTVEHIGFEWLVEYKYIEMWVEGYSMLVGVGEFHELHIGVEFGVDSMRSGVDIEWGMLGRELFEHIEMLQLGR